MSPQRYGFAGSILTLALSAAPAVRAEDSAGALARQHFRAGVTALEANDFEAALRNLRAAYELENCPEVQVTIAEVEERRAELSAAIAALQRYLELAPDGSLSETARARIEELEAKVGTETVAVSATPTPAGPAEPAATPNSSPSPEPASVRLPSAPVNAPKRPVPAAAWAAAPSEQRRPSSIRLPAFIAFGVGGLGASGALATGLMASGRYNDPANCTQHCGDGHTVSSRALAITSAVLAGVAATGIGVGVVLLLTSPAHPERNRLVPALRLKLTAEKAAAGAVWKF